MDVSSLRSKLTDLGQEHLLDFWDDPALTDEERRALYDDITGTNVAEVLRFFETSSANTNNTGKVDDRMEPIPSELFGSVTRSGKSLDKWYKEGKYSTVWRCRGILAMLGTH